MLTVLGFGHTTERYHRKKLTGTISVELVGIHLITSAARAMLRSINGARDTTVRYHPDSKGKRRYLLGEVVETVSVYPGHLFVPYNGDRQCDLLYSPPSNEIPDETTSCIIYSSLRTEQVRNVPHAYLLHASCCALIRRTFGPCVEYHYDVLADALRKAWETFPFDIDHCIREQTQPSRLSWRSIHRKSVGKGEVYAVDQVSAASDIVTPITDPYDVPAVRDIIVESKRRGRCNNKERWETQPSKMSPASKLNLPKDVLFSIFEWVHSVQDTHNAERAFDWRLSNVYWERRFPRDLLWEVDDESIRATDDVDWRYLCLKAEELKETSHAIKNRMRILRGMNKIRDEFRPMLEKKLRPEKN
ncbi:hypothetical protein AJ80_01201 [Polytolypa hystricis UAMH7299]|uniref:Uncharacterized protein n=1 Tax=Polytolypa hystricis (strain UAMH7299) TaxID=1447883 RepID=A0A2B7YZA4_POLH7|nr:hypothetical protein AJ80_01201 [Polytolypa hystricis UAMH7299]